MLWMAATSLGSAGRIRSADAAEGGGMDFRGFQS
jgi:hypothetical protein